MYQSRMILRSAAMSSLPAYAPVFSDVANLFEPDIIVPKELSRERPKGLGGGERRLMAALLSDGVEAFISYYSRSAEVALDERPEIVDWVMTRDYSYVFSFDVVCESLGLSPDYVRSGLINYVQALQEHRQAGEASRAWKKIRRPRIR